MAGDGNLSERVNFWSDHGNCRGLAIDYCGGSLGVIVVQVVGDSLKMTPLMVCDCLRLFVPAGNPSGKSSWTCKGNETMETNSL